MNELELTGRARTHIIDLEQPRCALHFAVVASLLAMRDAAARDGHRSHAGLELPRLRSAGGALEPEVARRASAV